MGGQGGARTHRPCLGRRGPLTPRSSPCPRPDLSCPRVSAQDLALPYAQPAVPAELGGASTRAVDSRRLALQVGRGPLCLVHRQAWGLVLQTSLKP